MMGAHDERKIIQYHMANFMNRYSIGHRLKMRKDMICWKIPSVVHAHHELKSIHYPMANIMNIHSIGHRLKMRKT